ncbi:MAG: cation diffusion facilitator family transporter, partial [bacterium]
MGIGVNLLLAAVKAAVGVLSGSIAVVLDAVNNLSDALSSLITLVGARLAAKEPDREHPLGHGRAEYLAGMIVAALVLYAGLTALMESGRQLFAPAEVSYAPVSLFLLAAAVAVKLFLGSYVKRVGERVSSASLVAAGKDALSDAALSASVLGSALLYRGTGLRLEAWVGAVIACFIVKAGVSLLRDAYDELLGRRVEGELVRELKATIAADEAVR